MGVVNVGLGDLRPYIPKIRAAAKGKIVERTSVPGVKAAILRELYDTIVDEIPVDTGALRDSPLMDGGEQDYGPSNKLKKAKSVHRYAHGDITDLQMTFDPYTSTGRHYAGKVEGFNPQPVINRRKKNKYNAIAKIIVKGDKP